MPAAKNSKAGQNGKKAAQSVAGVRPAGEAARYRATARCRVGRLRQPGEVFAWPAFESLPPYLEEWDGDDAGTPAPDEAGSAGTPSAAEVTALDLGQGEARPVHELSSIELIR